MYLEYDNKRTRENQELIVMEETEQKSEIDILCEFYKMQNNQDMDEEQMEFSKHLIEKLLGM